ncbi:hypothetical protein CKAH01_10711 [Colletotrichum kahawae]|uniref:C2H2-type domain-containing protein n=1 Tax=Colletotrichum kahawae TaxID=34407 RepID=A0AAE0CYJ4_COLKA|nr:hypothetical protein CKAH01_10711 [Colletotrichum kahawae]
MGILEFATTQRNMLRQMSEIVHHTEVTLKKVESDSSPVMVKRQELTQHPLPSDSSSWSSISTSPGMGGFSAVTSQASISDSSRIYLPSDRDRRSTSPASLQDDDDDINEEVHQAALDTMEMDDIDMNSLKRRGKGEYVCPFWRTCQKGGLEHDGTPKIFNRNCMFRQHIQKHSKPHKCRLPRCPNKEGFARKDQLLRHQQNVKHDHLEGSIASC